MNEEQYTNICDKLDNITRILIWSIIHDKELQDQVNFLDGINTKEADIARFLNVERDKVHSILRKKK